VLAPQHPKILSGAEVPSRCRAGAEVLNGCRGAEVLRCWNVITKIWLNKTIFEKIITKSNPSTSKIPRLTQKTPCLSIKKEEKSLLKSDWLFYIFENKGKILAPQHP
jgi:hypothetical protein